MAATSRFTWRLIDRPDQPSLFGYAEVKEHDKVRGIATSGWRGRSFSLGIADAVTVLAESASSADAAATIIANDVDLPAHPAITRLPACEIQPDNDLGARKVTRRVGPLRGDEVDQALRNGGKTARSLLEKGLIIAAALHLNGETHSVGHTSACENETARIEVHA